MKLITSKSKELAKLDSSKGIAKRLRLPSPFRKQDRKPFRSKPGQFAKRDRKMLTDQETSAYAEVLIASVLQGIAEGDEDSAKYFAWIFNCPDHGMSFSFEQACSAVPFDPDKIREGLECMYPDMVHAMMEGPYDHAR